jgi:hypothetical protein
MSHLDWQSCIHSQYFQACEYGNGSFVTREQAKTYKEQRSSQRRLTLSDVQGNKRVGPAMPQET